MELIFTFEVLLLFLAYSLLAYLFLLSSKLLFRLTWPQSLLLSTLITINIIFFGFVQDLFFYYKPLYFFSNTLLVLFLLFAIVLAIFFFLKKKHAKLLTANRFLMLLFLTLISFEIVRICIKVVSGKTISSIVHQMRSSVLDNEKIIAANQPDIYHIIFDGYANLPVVKEYWGYDNDIYPFLASKGFFTFDSAISNYNSTPFSISSIFNLQYLPGAEPFLVSTSPNFFLGQRIYKDNALFKFLKKNHYELSIFTQLEKKAVMLGLGFLGVQDQTYWIRNQTLERIYLNPWTLNKLKGYWGKNNTQPSSIIESMEGFSEYNNKALNHIFADCKNAAAHNSPVFSFTHIMLPHDPYIHDETGKILKSPEPGGANMKGYLAQLKYSNKLIRQITDCLLSDTTRKKIIIFQGDHGYRHFENAPLIKQYGTLNAFYFFNNNYLGLNKNMSNVNTYRIIINKFFEGKLPLLQDSIVALKKNSTIF